MELMGSAGYAYESHLEKYVRDYKIVQIWLGVHSVIDSISRRDSMGRLNGLGQATDELAAPVALFQR